MVALSLSILVPCFNEEASVGPLLQRLEPVVAALSRERAVEVLCVDDGSGDRTAELLAESERAVDWLRVETHSQNRGLGAAIATGIAASRHELVAMLDADGTYAPDRIPELLAKLESGYDVVVGSPFHPDGETVGVPRLRLFLSRSVSRVYRIVTRTDIHTFSSIFRVFRRGVLERVEITAPGFSAVTELLLQAARDGARVSEVATRLSARQTDASKLRVWKQIRDHLRLIARYAWRRPAVRSGEDGGATAGEVLDPLAAPTLRRQQLPPGSKPKRRTAK